MSTRLHPRTKAARERCCDVLLNRRTWARALSWATGGLRIVLAARSVISRSDLAIQNTREYAFLAASSHTDLVAEHSAQPRRHCQMMATNMFTTPPQDREHTDFTSQFSRTSLTLAASSSLMKAARCCC